MIKYFRLKVTDIIILTNHANLNDILAKYHNFNHIKKTAQESNGTLPLSSVSERSEIMIIIFNITEVISTKFQNTRKYLSL